MALTDIASEAWKGLSGLPRKLFGTRNDRLLKAYRQYVGPITDFEPQVRGTYDEDYAAQCKPIMDASFEDEAEREAQLQALRVKLSSDLLERSNQLRERIAPHMAELDDWWHALPDEKQLDEYFREEYRTRHARVIQEMQDEGILTEAMAVLREASRRAKAHRHFDCQLIGGRVLFEGKIAEMKTGEGKTIVCHLAAYLRVISGHKVHIITVNDYLVQRDAEFAQPIFELVGITVGYIQGQVDPSGREGIRKHAYGCDITYGTNSEFGFDYLRDNMKTRREDQVQGRLDYVIVDEVDSILIDEARTPLIISGPARDDVSRYPRADMVARELVKRQKQWDQRVLRTVAKYDGDPRNIQKLEDAMNLLGYKEHKHGEKNTDADDEGSLTLGPDFLTDDHVEAIQAFEAEVLGLPQSDRYRRYYILQIERKQAGLTHEGVTVAQEQLDMGSLYSGANMEWPHLIENALRAHRVYQRDKDYVVQNGEVIIVDPFTGRLMHGRQWSDGLHQSVEAKESVRVKEETQTLATITIQNFIKLYMIKAGMTGTALTEATEFDKIYKLEVVEIPTNRPINRQDHNDKMYRDTDAKYGAIVDEIHEVHRRGRPADPFSIADGLKALLPIHQSQGNDTSRIQEAINQFNQAEFGDQKVVRFMMEVYDEAMGDLARGRPILVGTTSVENSEKLSRALERRYGIDHEVLNAKNHAREAEIVAKAGQTTEAKNGVVLGNVTIATNMAGRGTDIKLGEGVVYNKCRVPSELPAGSEPSKLYPAGITKCCISCEEYDPATNCAHCFKPKLDPRFPALGRTVCPLNVPCGLHIVATERHESRRIDNQLRGRAGRQGDPGSSRFSLSLQDDLLKLFMPDWMLKMMDRHGFTDGASLEAKHLTKGIERAQRKVEERNFSTRKHLLEWDEPMDFQRKEFYAARQRILEERDLPALIFATTEEALEAAVDQFLGGRYHLSSMVEWCRSQLDVSLTEESIDKEDLEATQASIRRHAIDEAHDAIRTSLGEYIDREEDPKNWDLGGLLQWARRLYNISLTQNQLRKMSAEEIEETLMEIANEHYRSADLSGITIFLEKDYPQRSLVEWARQKFAIEVDIDEVTGISKEDVRELLEQHVRTAYHEREVAYPVESCMQRAYGETIDVATSADFVSRWANRRYNAGWTADKVLERPLADIRKDLMAMNREHQNGKLEQEFSSALAGKSDEQIIEWGKERIGGLWSQHNFDTFDGSVHDAVMAQGKEMLRRELTLLEQHVLLRIYDQAWKDHLLEMDHLKTAIMQRPLGGDQTHPQSQFAIEGRDQFAQMWDRIAARVTDIIFRVEAGNDGDSASRGTQASTPTGPSPSVTATHADSTGAGFSSSQTADQRAALRAQGVEKKTEQIVRETPKVGRNDPCPCGSGKKYKQCHGKA